MDTINWCWGLLIGSWKYWVRKEFGCLFQKCIQSIELLYWWSMARKSSFCWLLTPECILFLENSTQQTLRKSSIFRCMARHEWTIQFQRQLTSSWNIQNSAIWICKYDDYRCKSQTLQHFQSKRKINTLVSSFILWAYFNCSYLRLFERTRQAIYYQ